MRAATGANMIAPTMPTKTKQDQARALKARQREVTVRAWHAYHSLPRDRRGQPPSKAGLERKHGLGNGYLGKLFDGKRGARATPATIRALAAALGATPDWLDRGIGEAPVLTGELPDLPGTKGALANDNDRYPNRAIAIRAVGSYVDPEAVSRAQTTLLRNGVRDLPVVEWCKLIFARDEDVRRGV